MSETDRQDDLRRVLEWYDFLCPFCYVGQSRTALLVRHGLRVAAMPFQAHPDIPPGGIPAGPRKGPMYEMLEREAKEVGLPLNWPSRLPDTRLALAAAEWIRRHEPHAFPLFHEKLFEAHFVLGEDLGESLTIDRYATEVGADLTPLRAALNDGSAAAAVRESEILARKNGVQGTPTWLLAHRLIVGLRPAAEFERLAEYAMDLSR